LSYNTPVGSNESNYTGLNIYLHGGVYGGQ
jgi:hypothetical protein